MIVVTGGAGFLGSNLLAALEARGEHELVVCDRLRRGDKWRNIGKRELADIISPEALFDFLEHHKARIATVFHMGAVSSTTETDADHVIDNNFKTSLALWDWCAAHDTRFIYASSAATYGDGAQGFEDVFGVEELARFRPMNAYGWSKHLFDRRIARLLDRGRPRPPQWAGLKFFNVYGPNEYHKENQKSVVAQVYPAAEVGSPAHLFKSHHPDYPDGGQLRDFVWVDDCVDVMMWLYDTPGVNGLYNMGTGEARTFADLASAVFRALGKEPDIKYVDMPLHLRDRYQYFTQADMRRLRRAGYDRPFTSLEEGVTRYVQDYLHQPDPYR